MTPSVFVTIVHLYLFLIAQIWLLIAQDDVMWSN